MHPRAAELVATLQLQPHPEGGFYRELYRSPSLVTPTDGRGARPALTTIYFLLTDDTFSRWHRVTSDEVWHLYEGGPLEVLELDMDDHQVRRHTLASVAGDNQRPVHVVAAGRWQAARALGAYAFVGCTVGPGFDFADFRLLANDAASAAAVRREWPDLAALV